MYTFLKCALFIQKLCVSLPSRPVAVIWLIIYTNMCKTKLAQDKLRSPTVIIFIFNGVYMWRHRKNGQFMEYHIHISNIFSDQCPSISVHFDLCTPSSTRSPLNIQAIHMSLANKIHFVRINFTYLLPLSFSFSRGLFLPLYYIHMPVQRVL